VGGVSGNDSIDEHLDGGLIGGFGADVTVNGGEVDEVWLLDEDYVDLLITVIIITKVIYIIL
jgi:hypothetical protein